MEIPIFEQFHLSTAHLHFEARGIIIDTAEIMPGKFETMAMTPTGKEIAVRMAYNLKDAERDYHALLEQYGKQCKESEQPQESDLTGKYAKLRDDLKSAFEFTAYLDETEDGGTCNFDAPALCLPRWTEQKVEQAAKEAGGSARTWEMRGCKQFVIGFPTRCQGNARTRRAEALYRLLREKGYDAGMYYQMD